MYISRFILTVWTLFQKNYQLGSKDVDYLSPTHRILNNQFSPNFF